MICCTEINQYVKSPSDFIHFKTSSRLQVVYDHLYFGVLVLSCSYFSLFLRSKHLPSVPALGLTGDFSSLQRNLLSSFLSFFSTLYPLSLSFMFPSRFQAWGSFSFPTSPSGPGAPWTAVHPVSILSLSLSLTSRHWSAMGTLLLAECWHALMLPPWWELWFENENVCRVSGITDFWNLLHIEFLNNWDFGYGKIINIVWIEKTRVNKENKAVLNVK